MAREGIFSTLASLMEQIEWETFPGSGIIHTWAVPPERRIRLWTDVKSQPWIGQAEHDENMAQQTRMPYINRMKASWIIYHKFGKDSETSPTIYNNQILDAIEAALAPSPEDPGYFEERNTLFGKAHHCFIDGSIFKDPGDLDGQALLIVPITILVP